MDFVKGQRVIVVSYDHEDPLLGVGSRGTVLTTKLPNDIFVEVELDDSGIPALFFPYEIVKF